MDDLDEARLGWTVVLRRQPARIVAGRAEGGYTDAYELVCCECGDDPDADYREVSPELRQIRGPYPFAAGIAAYERHVSRYHRPQAPPTRAAPRDRSAAHPPGRPAASDHGWRNRNTAQMGAVIWRLLLRTWMPSMRRRWAAGT